MDCEIKPPANSLFWEGASLKKQKQNKSEKSHFSNEIIFSESDYEIVVSVLNTL